MVLEGKPKRNHDHMIRWDFQKALPTFPFLNKTLSKVSGLILYLRSSNPSKPPNLTARFVVRILLSTTSRWKRNLIRLRLSMAHETLIFGFILGPHRAWDDQFPLFERNTQAIHTLPEIDVYPAMSRGMFTIPDFQNRSVVFRRPMIHFGSSINHIEFGDVPEWLTKFEALLSQLYWSKAEVHFITDVLGPHRYAWEADLSVFDAYHAGNPQPTTKWQRTLFGGSEPIPEPTRPP